MKRLIIILLLCNLWINAQTVFSDSFNNFVPLDTSASAFWVFDGNYHIVFGDSVKNDLAGTNDLLLNGWANYAAVADSLTDSNPFYNGGNALKFSSTRYLKLAAGTTGDLAPGSGDFTIMASFKVDNLSAHRDPFGYGNTFATSEKQYAAQIRTNGELRFGIYDGSGGAYIDPSTFTYNTVSVGQVYQMVVSVDRDGQQTLYVNGVAADSQSVTNSVDISGASQLFTISSANSILPFDGTIYNFGFWDRAMSKQEVKKLWALPYGWISTNGNVLKTVSESNFFATAFSDTLGIPLPDATLGANQEWVFDVKSKDTDGSGSTNWWIGKKREPKTVVKTVNCGASFANDKVYFGDGFALSSDTLWVAIADTASVDNVVLSKARHHLIQRKSGWLGW